MSAAAAFNRADRPVVLLDDSPEPASTAGTEYWRVLIVDDEPDVHTATEFAMRDLVVEGRPLALLHAHSASEALALVAADADIAVVLLDVVMETADAGLQLVRRIRNELGRTALRIILRTGQPGYAPELETLRSFDINDYRTKEELTRERLFGSLTAAIRSYKLIDETMRQRDELQRLNESLVKARAAERLESRRRLEAEDALRAAGESVELCVAQRTRELSDAIAELEGFNRMVSHDLSGPLHGIARLSELMQRELDAGNTAELRHWLSLVGRQTRHLAGLVTDLLDLARVSKGELQRRPVGLDSVVADALQTLTVASGSAPSIVSVGPMPELSVDAGLLRQVFVNLLSNALKFTRGVADPKIRVYASHSDGEWVIEVRDNGVGFDSRRAGELFKPFTRLHSAAYEGAGIGLTIARRIVERHGGRIWAESAAGKGASFRFTLPA